MIDIRYLIPNLPAFIERSYNISPGVVSVVFKAVWSIFTFLMVTFLIHSGFAAAGIDKNETNSKKRTLWRSQCNYEQVQSITHGSWGNMLCNISSKRVAFGFLFWIILYSFEILFSLTIDTAYVSYYNGTKCVGRVDDFNIINTTMYNKNTSADSGNYPPKNITLLRQLLNQKHVGNIGMLGDGIFTISPSEGLYRKDQRIKVARAGFDCSTPLYLQKNALSSIFLKLPSGDSSTNLSTPHYINIDSREFDEITSAYVNLKKITNNGQLINQNTDDERFIYLILLTNPGNISEDVNNKLYNSTVFLSECVLFYEHGLVTIQEDGYLNETNIGESYTKVKDHNVDMEFLNSYIDNHLRGNSNFLSVFDFPDVFLTTDYNRPYPETLKIMNNIVTAHFFSGLDPYADLCTFNQEEVPVYFSVLGTKMSFGYIAIGAIFALVSLSALTVSSFIMFTPEERCRWLLYSKDWCFIGYISTGDTMDKGAFKLYAKNTSIVQNQSSEIFEDHTKEEEQLYPSSPVNKIK